MKPDLRPRLTYTPMVEAILYQGKRRLTREWAVQMLAYHEGVLATPGISQERRQNNERWRDELVSAIAEAWPEQKESAA